MGLVIFFRRSRKNAGMRLVVCSIMGNNATKFIWILAGFKSAGTVLASRCTTRIFNIRRTWHMPVWQSGANHAISLPLAIVRQSNAKGKTNAHAYNQYYVERFSQKCSVCA